MRFFTFWLVLILCFGCNKVSTDSKVIKQSITIFAAASLTNVLKEIVATFKITNPINIKVNYASSGTLARQIAQGATADIYLAADQKWMDYIKEQGYLIEGQSIDIAQNQLVLITAKNSTLSTIKLATAIDLHKILGTERLAMGDPNHVPAGKYAQESLRYHGWYKSLKNKILPTKDVRSALKMVELEETPLGIVYQTDAIQSNQVKILSTFSTSSHQPIVYIAGQCQNHPNALKFYQFLQSERCQQIWIAHGFNHKSLKP